MILELKKELETYIAEQKPKSDDKKLIELQQKILEEYKESNCDYILGKIKLNKLDTQIFYDKESYKESDTYHFLIPEKNSKLYNMIVNFNDLETGIFYGIDSYIKQLGNIYKMIEDLDGIILSYI